MRLPALFRRRPPRPDSAADRHDLARQVRRIELKARRLMDSPAWGQYESMFRGHGIEFSEVRAYEPGDPFQAIDWKVTARMRRPYVKRFVEEREMTVLLVVDVSASNEFGTRERLKRRLASEVAGLLALAALRSQERVGLLLFSDHVERLVRPLRGRNRSLRLIYELLSFQPTGTGTDLAGALTTAARVLNVRSLVFVISDFGNPQGLAKPLLALASRHDVVAIDVRDPAEAKLPDGGWVEMVDPESGATRVVDMGDPSVRAEFASATEKQEEELARLLRRARTDRIPLSVDSDYATAIASFFAARGRRRRRA